ncbi:MAG TPA: hypothetical protein VNR88_05485 [Hyphomicrobium sp.]|nr:hypothetical protein [Hyphomicrobium sp.]
MARKDKKPAMPDPLEPGHIPGQNPATPERMPGHTRFHDDEAEKNDEAEKKAAEDAELDDALEQTFPASDPISFESTLVAGRRRR